MVFVDLEKAFDNANWKILFNIMNNARIDIKDRIILYTIYKNQKAEIKINSKQRSEMSKTRMPTVTHLI